MPVVGSTAYNTVGNVVPLIQSLLNDQQGATFIIPGSPLLIVGAPSGAVESGTTATITTVYPHGLLPGQSVTVTGVGVGGYNGSYTILTCPTPNSFTYTTGGGLSASGGGLAVLQGGTIQPGQINLLDHLNSSYRKIRRKLTNIGQQTFTYDNVIITVPALSAPDPTAQVQINDATAPPNNLPFNLIEPVKLWERVSGTSDQFVEMVDMSGRGGLPSRPQDTTRLSIWEWRTDALVFIGALTNVDVRIRYKAGLPDLISGGDTILTRDILDALAFLTAAEVLAPRGSPLAAQYLSEGEDALEDLIQAQVHFDQMTGRRRRSYSHRKGLNR